MGLDASIGSLRGFRTASIGLRSGEPRCISLKRLLVLGLLHLLDAKEMASTGWPESKARRRHAARSLPLLRLTTSRAFRLGREAFKFALLIMEMVGHFFQVLGARFNRGHTWVNTAVPYQGTERRPPDTVFPQLSTLLTLVIPGFEEYTTRRIVTGVQCRAVFMKGYLEYLEKH